METGEKVIRDLHTQKACHFLSSSDGNSLSVREKRKVSWLCAVLKSIRERVNSRILWSSRFSISHRKPLEKCWILDVLWRIHRELCRSWSYKTVVLQPLVFGESWRFWDSAVPIYQLESIYPPFQVSSWKRLQFSEKGKRDNVYIYQKYSIQYTVLIGKETPCKREFSRISTTIRTSSLLRNQSLSSLTKWSYKIDR